MKKLIAVGLLAALPLLAACDDYVDDQNKVNDARFKYCVSHGGSFATHGDHGSTYECRFPGKQGGKVDIRVDNK